jgi:hypothetical protein
MPPNTSPTNSCSPQFALKTPWIRNFLTLRCSRLSVSAISNLLREIIKDRRDSTNGPPCFLLYEAHLKALDSWRNELPFYLCLRTPSLEDSRMVRPGITYIQKTAIVRFKFLLAAVIVCADSSTSWTFKLSSWVLYVNYCDQHWWLFYKINHLQMTWHCTHADGRHPMFSRTSVAHVGLTTSQRSISYYLDTALWWDCSHPLSTLSILDYTVNSGNSWNISVLTIDLGTSSSTQLWSWLLIRIDQTPR